MFNKNANIKNINLFIIIILFLLSTNLLANSSKLSDVMDSANENKTENKKVYRDKTSKTSLLCGILDVMSTDDDTKTKKNNEDDTEDEESKSSTTFQTEKTLKDSWAGFKIGDGRIYSNKYGRYKYVDIFLGDYSEEKFLTQGVIGVGTISLADDTIKQHNELKDSISGSLLLLNIGIETRKYFTPRYTFFGNYLLLGARLNYLMWSYKKEVYADVYDGKKGTTTTEKITSDELFGLNLYTGWGFNVMQTKKMDIGAEVVAGTMLWWFETNKGFQNDIFDPFTYVNFNLVFNFKIS